jgi:FkbM family methyltransferase
MLVDYLDEHPAAALAGPVIRGFDGAEQDSAWRAMTITGYAIWALTFGQHGVAVRGETARPVQAVSACAMLVRREAMEAVGLFDESYFMFSEEWDLAQRLHRLGLECHFVPEVEVRHHGQESTKHLPERQVNEIWRSLDLYLARYHRPLEARVLRSLWGLGYAFVLTAAAVGRALPSALRPAQASSWTPEVYRLHVRNALRGIREPGFKELADEWNRAHAAGPAPEVRVIGDGRAPSGGNRVSDAPRLQAHAVPRYYVDVVRGERRPVRFLISRLLMSSGLSKGIVIQKRGFRLRFYPTNASAQQWVDPYHQYDKDHGYREETFVRRFLRPGDVVVDVGANVGITALAAFSVVGSSGQVHAFEPHPRIFDFLAGNIELNDAGAVVTPYKLALGDHDGTAFLTDYHADDQNTVSIDITDVEVRMSTLDDAVRALPCIALLKIDVEGYEKFVLLGGTQTLPRVRCIYFESLEHELARHGHKVGDVIAFLASHDFKVRRLADGASTTVPLSADACSSDPSNLVAAHDLDDLHRRLARRPLAVAV